MVKMQKQPMYEDTFKPEIEKLADNAKKSYASQFKAEDKKIILIGSSFDEEEKTIGEWVCENL